MNEVKKFKRYLSFGSNMVIGVPCIWMWLFFLLPFFIVLKISFSEASLSIPPYQSLISWLDEKVVVTLSLSNYILLTEDFGVGPQSSSFIIIFITILISVVSAWFISRKLNMWQYLEFVALAVVLFWFIIICCTDVEEWFLSVTKENPILHFVVNFCIYFPPIFALISSNNANSILSYWVKDLQKITDNGIMLGFSLGMIIAIFRTLVDMSTESIYIAAYLNSLHIATIATFFCVLIGYPMALAISRADADKQVMLLMLVTIPAWTALLIRVYAWMGILGNQGLLNSVLIYLGILTEPLQILNTNTAVYIGLVYSYLSFMILPLYANLSKQDGTLLEAAADLGMGQFKSFWFITFALSKTGIFTGCLLVFIPIVGEFVIPELLGGSQTLMIGRIMWEEFFNNRDWPVASALAIVMLLILMAPIIVFNKYQHKDL